MINSRRQKEAALSKLPVFNQSLNLLFDFN